MIVVVLVAVWPIACATGSSNAPDAQLFAVNGPGDERCPCETAEELGDEFGNATYGLLCNYHDSSTEDCSGVSPETYCTYAWCYVKPLTCTLPMHPSSLTSGRWWSYPTCGFLDAYTTYTLQHSLYNATLLTAVLTNSGGWKGSYCSAAGDCSGPMHDFLMRTLVGEGARPDVVSTFTDVQLQQDAFVPEVMGAVYRADPNESSSFQACVYATGMGYIDLCIGSFTMSAERRLISNMIMIDLEPVYLVAPQSNSTHFLWTNLGKTFMPFTPGLWIVIICITICLSLLMVWHEHVPGGYFSSYSCIDALRHSLYRGCVSFMSAAPLFDPATPGGRSTTLALGIMVLMTTAAYTANLASLLVTNEVNEASASEIGRIVGSGQRICVPVSQKESIIGNTGIPQRALAIKLNRADALEAVGTDCVAAAVRHEDLQEFHSEGRFCYLNVFGYPLYYTEVGVPVSERYYRALQYVVKLRLLDGNWSEIQKMYEVRSLCGTMVRNDYSLTISDFCGPICITLGLCLLGCCCSCVCGPIYMCIRKCTQIDMNVVGFDKSLDDFDRAGDVDWGVSLNESQKRAHQAQDELVRLLLQVRPEALPQLASQSARAAESLQPIVKSWGDVDAQRPVHARPHILERALQGRTRDVQQL